MATIFSHFWRLALPFTYLDVGAKYGAGAIHLTLYVRALGHDNRIVCFEPGSSSELLAANISANGLADDIAFEPIAVSDRVGSATLFGEKGYPENNRIVNPVAATQAFSRQIPTTSLDAYVSAHQIAGHLIIKVDTQGAEWEVLAGMKRVRKDRLIVMVIEFTPWALETRVPPARFLDELADGSHLLDLGMLFSGHGGLPPKVLLPESHREFPAEVMRRKGCWTDLLVVPRRLPDAQALVDAVLDSGMEART